ncbi:MAG: trigger factor [Ruminococcaceae bacterium]|nr:trigger factor [Oscillospiraceae bacterium]
MSLKSSNNVETNVYALEIAISAEEFDAAQNKAFNKQKNKIQIPGFRKGKVTRKMAETFYGKGWLYEDALDMLFGKAVEDAAKEAELDVVGTKSADVKEIGENGVEMVVEVFVKPEIELTEYKELKATKKKVEATEEEINDRIGGLLERNARLVSVEDRAAQNGDITVIDFEGFVDGVAFQGGKGESYELTLGSGQFIPGFEDQVAGHNAGEEFDVNVKFPTEYTPELADKDAVFKVKLHEIKVKELPELDDEFAQDAADCDTVAQLKKNIENEIKEHKDEENEREIESQLLEKLSENVKGEIPECMIDTELDNQIRDIDYRLSMQGMSFDTYLQYSGMTVEQYKENSKPSAEKNVKVRLALEYIVKAEALEVSDEDLEAEYDKFAERYQMEKDKIKELVPAEGLRKDLLNERAIKFVRDNAKVTTARKPRAKKEEADKTDAE